MKLAEKFTPEQLTAFEALEEMFGPTKIEASEVSKHYASQYAPYAAEYLGSALKNFARAKMAETIDFAEIDRLQREEYDRKLAERSAEVRGNIMMGMFTSLVSKVSKAVPLGTIGFGSDEECIFLTCHIGLDEVLEITYDKQIFVLETSFTGGYFEDNATFVMGSTSFRDQFTGVEALYSFLEGRDNG